MNAVLPKLEATRPLRWSQCAITFNSADQLKCAATAGALPMLFSPVISNVQVTKTLIDGGAGLNVLSVDTFDNLQVPYEQLQPTKPFSGVTDDSTTPIGQVRLPVTFGERKNYRMELIDFDIAHTRLPYNTILGYPALAKFMAITHHGYNVLKAMLAFLHYRHHPEGVTTTIKTRGLGASRSRALSPASWAELKPQPRSVSSSSLLVK